MRHTLWCADTGKPTASLFVEHLQPCNASAANAADARSVELAKATHNGSATTRPDHECNISTIEKKHTTPFACLEVLGTVYVQRNPFVLMAVSVNRYSQLLFGVPTRRVPGAMKRILTLV